MQMDTLLLVVRMVVLTAFSAAPTMVAAAAWAAPPPGTSSASIFSWCMPTTTAIIKFPNIGREMSRIKCHDSVSGAPHLFTFEDTKLVPESTFSAARRQEASEAYSKKGAMSAGVEQLLEECKTGNRTTVSVVAWSRIQPEPELPKDLSKKPTASTFSHDLELMLSHSNLQDVCTTVNALSCNPIPGVPAADMIVACDQLEKLAFAPGVLGLFPGWEFDLVPANNGTWMTAINSSPAYQSGGVTYNGAGTKVCVLEAGNVDNLDFNPGLIRMNPSSPPTPLYHATMTVGIVQSTSAVPGVAPASQVYLANWSFPTTNMSHAVHEPRCSLVRRR